MSESRGFICAATTEEYVRLAYGLALSLKATYQKYPLSIIVQDRYHVDPEWEDAFDQIFEIPSPDNVSKFYQRSFFHEVSPYDYTIALDADMVFSRQINDWWDLMIGDRPIVMSDAVTYRGNKTSRMFRKVFDIEGIPDAYSAFFMFDKSKKTKEFFKLLGEMLSNWNSYCGVLSPNWAVVQPATTDVCMGLVFKALNMRSSFIGWRPKFVHLKPEIQDNYIDLNIVPNLMLTPKKYPYQDERSIIEIGRISQIYPVHYFNKEWLTDERLKQLEVGYEIR